MALRVALIGTGFGATVQLPGFRRLPDVEVVAVASARLARAREVAGRFGIPHAFDDYRAMLNTVEIDLVSVAAPPHLHFEMVMAALERGKHVICEKPFALNLGEAQQMLREAERAGVVHALDHEFRYLPGRTGLKQRLAEGFVGEPRLFQIVWRSDSRARAEDVPFDWWSERSKGGGVLGAIGSHYIDSVRWWLGEIREVSAALTAAVPRRRLPDGSGWADVTSDDTASVVLRLANGCQGTINLSAAGGVRGNRVEVYGSAGSLIVEDDERLWGARRGEPLTELPRPAERFAAVTGEARMVGPFAELAARVVARIRGEGGEDFPTFREGVAVQAALDAIYRASDERRWMTVLPT